MTAAEIERAREMSAGGATPREVAAALGRHERTVRRAIKGADDLIARRRGPRARRALMDEEGRRALREMAIARNAGRPGYLRSAAWSDKWFDEQQAAFVAAMLRAHPELAGAGSVALWGQLARPLVTDAERIESLAAGSAWAGREQLEGRRLDLHGGEPGAAGAIESGRTRRPVEIADSGQKPTRHGARRRVMA